MAVFHHHTGTVLCAGPIILFEALFVFGKNSEKMDPSQKASLGHRTDYQVDLMEWRSRI